MMYVSQIIMLYTLSVTVLYVNYMSIKPEEKNRFIRKRQKLIQKIDQGCEQAFPEVEPWSEMNLRTPLIK